jgi:hypothetical protein
MMAKIPGVDPAKFITAATTAKAGCPIPRLLKANVAMDAKLEPDRTYSPRRRRSRHSSGVHCSRCCLSSFDSKISCSR